MALKGDFARLHRYVKQVERLGSPDAMQSLTDNLAEEAIDLIVEGMGKGVDPYGKKHAPKVFPDGRSLLVGNTTRLLRGWKRTRSDGRGFLVTPSVEYAKYHQQGTGIYGPHKKRIVPKNAKALAFFAHGHGMAAARKRQGLLWAASLGARANSRTAKASFDKAMSKVKGSVMFVRSVKGCPKRLMVPRKNDLPSAWLDAFADTALDWFKANFKRRK